MPFLGTLCLTTWSFVPEVPTKRPGMLIYFVVGPKAQDERLDLTLDQKANHLNSEESNQSSLISAGLIKLYHQITNFGFCQNPKLFYHLAFLYLSSSEILYQFVAIMFYVFYLIVLQSKSYLYFLTKGSSEDTFKT